MHAVPASHLARTVPHRDLKWAGGAQPIRYAGFVRSRSPVVRRARATGDMRPTGRAQHSRVTEARAEGSRTARGRASIRWPGRRGTPGWTTRAGAARACPRRHRTTPEIERGGRRPTRSASPRAVERTRDTDRGSPRRLVRAVGSLDATCAADAAPTAACPKTASSARSRNDRPAERRRGQAHRRPTCGSISPTSITVPAYLVTGARIGGWSKLLQAARAPSETAVPGRRGRRRASR